MRSLIVYAFVIFGGAIALAISVRAERWVDPEGEEQSVVRSLEPGEITGLTLRIYAPGKTQGTLLRTITVTPKKIVIGDDYKTLEGEFGQIQRALAALPRRMLKDTKPAADPATGGDVLIIERGKLGAKYVATSGWETGPVDPVKETIWRVVRARWKPKRKRRPNTEFVEPFESLRNQLRIRF